MKGKKMKLSSITTKYTLPIGQQIVEGLEKGGLKWFKPFLENSLSNAPKNAISGYEYNGVNFWNMSFVQQMYKFKMPLFASANAWKTVNAFVKPEEEKNCFPIFYWFKVKNKKTKKNDNDEEEEKTSYYRMQLKITMGYNADQMDLSKSNWTYPKPQQKTKNKVIQNLKIDDFVKNQNGLVLKHSNEAKCYYSSTLDYVHMTNKKNFIKTKNGTDETLEYYSTLLHELIHWTGHEKRTNRFEKNKKEFKDNERKAYAIEELNAEIGANILCIYFDLQKTVNKNSLAYLASWKKYLSDDAIFIYKALSGSTDAIKFLENNLKTAKKVKKTA